MAEKEQDEREWLQRLREGDNRAFERLFSSYYSALCAFAVGYLEDNAAAEDVVQDVFLKLCTEKPVFETVVSLKSYLYLVTKNLCLNVLKHRRIEEDYAQGQVAEKEKTTFFFNQIVEQELLLMLNEAAKELPEQTERVVRLMMEGLDNTEIAERLGLTMDAVKAHKKRGRAFLKRRLGDLTALLLILVSC